MVVIDYRSTSLVDSELVSRYWNSKESRAVGVARLVGEQRSAIPSLLRSCSLNMIVVVRPRSSDIYCMFGYYWPACT